MTQTLLLLKQKAIVKRYYVFSGLFFVTLLWALVYFLKLNRDWDQLLKRKVKLHHQEIDLETWREKSAQLDRKIIWFDDRVQVSQYLKSEIINSAEKLELVGWLSMPKIIEQTATEIYSQQLREPYPSVQAVFEMEVKKGQVGIFLKELSSKPFLQIDELTVAHNNWSTNRCEIKVTQTFAEKLVTKVGSENL